MKTTMLKKALLLVAANMLSVPVFSYTCGIDNHGFIYTCCAQYTCRLGIGTKCMVNSPPGSLSYITGFTTPTWIKESACTASAGWQASSVCSIPLGNSQVTRTCN